MSHWMLDILGDKREFALYQANLIQINNEFSVEDFFIDYSLICDVVKVLELVVLDLSYMGSSTTENDTTTLKKCASDAFRLMRVLPRPLNEPLKTGKFLLKLSALGIIGDMGADAARLLRENPWPSLIIDSNNWSERTWGTVIEIWLLLIRKSGWNDRDIVLEKISNLRESQRIFEKEYLDEQDVINSKASALELIALYHLAKAAEIFALFITDGVVNGKYQIHNLLDMHFDRVFAICEDHQFLELEPFARLLAASSHQMANNSIWMVTRAVNSRVTDFVKTLVDRGRGEKAIFDVLPPQRRALAEKGLLGSSRRAIVVNLPTSSGKTLIAEFRILQALNQFEVDKGWIAYLSPTRTLVNQITRRLRKDFEPLNIIVEQVSPALEVDSVEMNILTQEGVDKQFRILVTTPEKFDLMLRQGCEKKINRPLTLVIVDEAHNIQNNHRGLKLELLLATINNECKFAQFLLLTPFISNAAEIAQWLGGQNFDDISLSIDWQPNDRVIGITHIKKGDLIRGRSYDYNVLFETVQTNKKTIHINTPLKIEKNQTIAKNFRNASNIGNLAAITAQHFHKRGPVIVMHSKPQYVWSLAEKLKIEENLSVNLSDYVKVVQDFLKLEFGSDFPLVELLSYGIGVHHAGLSDDVRALMEWLFEKNELKFLIATTTIAQGVNFPVSGVVMASHQYPYGIDMPPEDFWNIAGRAGRVDQGSLGIVALVADTDDKRKIIKEFIQYQERELNSALIVLAKEAQKLVVDLEKIVYSKPEWSAFLQYLTHSYCQLGRPRAFGDEIEQVLRGTLGFEKLRIQDTRLANLLLLGIQNYAQYLQQPGQPISLVDSTGFSLQSIRIVLSQANNVGINRSIWDGESLFSDNNLNLQNMMGVLLSVPELRENLNDVTGGITPNGNKLALIIKDWVNGIPVQDIACKYFMNDGDTITQSITTCGQNLYSRLTQTAAWGLGALLSITGGDIPDEEFQNIRNLPSFVYYGVNSDKAIALRLIGIPRTAAIPLSSFLDNIIDQPLSNVRMELKNKDELWWNDAMGNNPDGKVFRKIWHILEGFD